LGALAAASGAQADEAAPASWADTITFSGYIDAGVTANPQNPANDINFGHLYTDRTNTPVLNQFALTATRPLDPKATGYDFGFTFTGMVGTDARYTHFDGELDRTLNGTYQMTILEADALFHLPWLTDGGIDAKLGQWPSPMSAESVTPASNPFYSHSYIYNFGVTVSHTGFWTTTHVDPMLDIYLGIDTGNQTTLGSGNNNNVGVGLNLLGGNLTVVGLSHFGPENPNGAGEPFSVNGAYRWYNDITTTWKASDTLTLTTDLNYVHDDGFNTSGYGIAQYVSYQIDDQFTLQGRGEVFWDPEGFYVAAFPNPLDAVNALEGKPNTSFSGGHTTYGELTFGVNYKPPVSAPFTGLVIRPEIRYDASLNGTHPFGTATGTSGHQFTLGTDIIIPF
jgi:hypothetical protein